MTTNTKLKLWCMPVCICCTENAQGSQELKRVTQNWCSSENWKRFDDEHKVVVYICLYMLHGKCSRLTRVETSHTKIGVRSENWKRFDDQHKVVVDTCLYSLHKGNNCSINCTARTVFWLRPVRIRSTCIGEQYVLILVSVRGTMAQALASLLAVVRASANRTCETCLLSTGALCVSGF